MGDTRKLILPALATAVLVTVAYFIFGPIPAGVFVVAFGGGLLFYIATAWRTEFDTMKVIVPYLLTVVFFMVHTYEEYVTDFAGLVSRLSGQDLSERNVITFVGWVAPIMWIGGGILLIKRWSFGYYFLCAFFLAMVIAELSHYVFPFMIDGTFHYEPGMYTALLPLIPAAFGLRIMLREVGRIRAAGVGHAPVAA